MKVRYIISIIIFLFLIVLGCAVSVFDKDAVFSESEKRMLATMPEVSFARIKDASFMKDFETYYNDTFPLRDSLMEISKTFKGMLYPDIFVSDNDSVKFTVSTSGSAAEEENSENIQGLLFCEGRLMHVFARDDAKSQRYADAVNRLYEECGQPDTYVILPPPAYTLYSPEKDRTEANDFSAALSSFESMLQGPVLVNCNDEFMENKDQYIYFRSDHHWTARGAYIAANKYAHVAEGEFLAPISEYRRGVLSGFLGSLYDSIATEPAAKKLEENKDDVEFFYPMNNAEINSYSSADLSDPEERLAIYDNYDKDKNLYNVFFGGDIPIGYIKSDINNGKSVLLVRDSYGHAFLEYLIDLYEDIYVIEPRYFNETNSFSLGQFFREKEIDNLLFLNYSCFAVGGFWTDIDSYLVNFYEKPQQ